MLPNITSAEGEITAQDADALLIGSAIPPRGVSGVLRDVGSRLGGSLEDFLAATGYGSRLGEVRTIATFGRIRPSAVVVIGLGDLERTTPFELRSSMFRVARELSGIRRLVSAVHLDLREDPLVRASISGLLLGLTRRVEDGAAPPSIAFAGPEAAIRRAEIGARAVALACDLVDEPPSSLTPTRWAELAEDLARDSGLGCTVWGSQELERRGFGGILAVARGSQQEPKLIHLHYQPPDPSRRIALAGKGVTFDAGGMNLKLDREGLSYMKFDMAGGAAVMGCMSALRSLGVRAEVHALIPAAANLPGPQALLPGDVIRHLGGATTEVTDTDSEGRLLLADALAYATELGAEVIVDAATLTETAERALGPDISAVFSNDAELASALIAAGARAGEPMWQLPLHTPYAVDLRSSIADARNQALADGFVGGAIKASLFLSRFVGPGIGWAHLDVAGTAYRKNFADPAKAGATGVPTAALLEWLEGQ